MTKRRYDNHSTEFGLWLREQQKIKSSLGYTATNIDYLWHNRFNNKWMMIEEKRKLSAIPFWQVRSFKILDSVCKNDPNYIGFHYLKFENTSPNDGRIYLNGNIINSEILINLLRFKINIPGMFK